MAFINATGLVTFGTNERDIITGRPEMDIILARAGDDEIFRFPSGPGAGGGDDIIDAGDGDDGREFFVAGDEGNDVILGGRGEDDLFGGPGNDVIVGEEGTRSPVARATTRSPAACTRSVLATARPTSSSSTSDLASASPVSPRRTREKHGFSHALAMKSAASSPDSMGSG